ncbi:hypothetical protein LFML04_0108 [Leptospirillum ferriphilum ML-04]|uniref:Uncharacterized protein n=1 Tax=Leptospirillum ferriphilum (strain ML-04) TaxID=1048260 RepID=J9Z783_LEPFM|nr:hypothetical protein LFML04_0108 [Leptospirillum ferriphilum ML-04]
MGTMFDFIVVIQYLYKILHCQGFGGEPPGWLLPPGVARFR